MQRGRGYEDEDEATRARPPRSDGEWVLLVWWMGRARRRTRTVTCEEMRLARDRHWQVFSRLIRSISVGDNRYPVERPVYQSKCGRRRRSPKDEFDQTHRTSSFPAILHEQKRPPRMARRRRRHADARRSAERGGEAEGAQGRFFRMVVWNGIARDSQLAWSEHQTKSGLATSSLGRWISQKEEEFRRVRLDAAGMSRQFSRVRALRVGPIAVAELQSPRHEAEGGLVVSDWEGGERR